MWMDSWVLNIPYEYWPTIHGQKVLYRFFEMERDVVVLSSSNKAHEEVYEEKCLQDSIPLLRRQGGGGTVLLTQGMVVLTLALHSQNKYNHKEHFKNINSCFMGALESMGVQHLSQRGISDIAIHDKKIVGTSMFRKQELLVYQASLLVHPSLTFIESILKHPTREPDYREKRSHAHFITSLHQEGYVFTCENIVKECTAFFKEHFHNYF